MPFALLLSVLAYVLWAIVSSGLRRHAKAEEWRANEVACAASLRNRDPRLDALQDYSRGFRQPIIVEVGDDVRSKVAPGLGECEQWHAHPHPRDNFACGGGLAGPDPRVLAYARKYNLHLSRLAHGQMQSAHRCSRHHQ